MGHSKVTTALTIYSHLFPSDHTDAMMALSALAAPVADNVPSRLTPSPPGVFAGLVASLSLVGSYTAMITKCSRMRNQ